VNENITTDQREVENEQSFAWWDSGPGGVEVRRRHHLDDLDLYIGFLAARQLLIR
jgi:hypothetical protein